LRLPPQLEKIWFFGVKSWFLTRNTPKIFALNWNSGSALGLNWHYNDILSRLITCCYWLNWHYNDILSRLITGCNLLNWHYNDILSRLITGCNWLNWHYNDILYRLITCCYWLNWHYNDILSRLITGCNWLNWHYNDILFSQDLCDRLYNLTTSEVAKYRIKTDSTGQIQVTCFTRNLNAFLQVNNHYSIKMINTIYHAVRIGSKYIRIFT
jgi:hypothetical protein